MLKNEGHFYIGQPIPEYNPCRLKLGYTQFPKRRLKDHRCASPWFTFIGSYSSKPEWETPMFEHLRQHFRFINKETLECDNIQDVLEECDKCFIRLCDGAFEFMDWNALQKTFNLENLTEAWSNKYLRI